MNATRPSSVAGSCERGTGARLSRRNGEQIGPQRVADLTKQELPARLTLAGRRLLFYRNYQELP